MDIQIFGSTFGYGDLLIYDKANTDNYSQADLGYSYENNNYTHNTR